MEIRTSAWSTPKQVASNRQIGFKYRFLNMRTKSAPSSLSHYYEDTSYVVEYPPVGNYTFSCDECKWHSSNLSVLDQSYQVQQSIGTCIRNHYEHWEEWSVGTFRANIYIYPSQVTVHIIYGMPPTSRLSTDKNGQVAPEYMPKLLKLNE